MQISETFIHIEKIRFYAYHGVLPQERKTGTYFLVSLHIGTDFRAALESDKLEDTLNYAAIYEAVKEEMQVPSQLLEHVAGRIVKRLYREFPTISSISMRLDKENPPMGADCLSCGIELHTQR